MVHREIIDKKEGLYKSKDQLNSRNKEKKGSRGIGHRKGAMCGIEAEA